MNREIQLINLVYEFKRKLAIILIVGLVIAGAMVTHSYIASKQSLQINTYGAQCALRVNESADVAISGEKSRGIILSDDVIKKVCEGYNAAHSGDVALSIQDVRACVYPIPSDDGSMVKIFVVTDNQSKSTEMCKLLAPSVQAAMTAEGLDAKIVQETQDLGTVSVSTAEDYGKIDRVTYVIKPIEQLSVNMGGVVKRGVAGFIIGILLGYVCVCVVYIVRGRVVYANEIADAELECYGVMGADSEKNKYCIEKAVSSVLLEGKSVKSLLMLSYACTIDFAQAAEICKQEGVSLTEGEDLRKNPMAKLKAKDCDACVLALKSDSMKFEELCQLRQEMLEGANGIAGVILVK